MLLKGFPAYSETEEKTGSRGININRRCAMTTRQLQIQAHREWDTQSDIKCQYHTFEHYWSRKARLAFFSNTSFEGFERA